MQQLTEMGQLLHQFNDREFKRKLSNEVRKAARPSGDEAKQAALRVLPKHGGLNKFVATSRTTVRTTTSGKNVGVRLTASKKGHDLRSIDDGFVRHPIYGDRSRFVSQRVPVGWFTLAVQKSGPAVQKAVVDAIGKALTELHNKHG